MNFKILGIHIFYDKSFKMLNLYLWNRWCITKFFQSKWIFKPNKWDITIERFTIIDNKK